MLTWQDFAAEAARGEERKSLFIGRAIDEHEAGEDYKTAVDADLYDRQRNSTIKNYIPQLFTSSGARVENFVASNNQAASGFFNLLNTQRNSFLLGNGVTFSGDRDTKARLGERFDADLLDAGYYALIHGVSFPFWNGQRLRVFKLTEFVPLWDEETGALRAGIRYWCLERGARPVYADLYEEEGVTRYKTGGNAGGAFVPRDEGGRARPYIRIVSKAPADLEGVTVGENYGALPVVPLYGSRLHQSTLIGMKENIDSYDLIYNGWANDLRDCAQIYWLLENYGGMSDDDLNKFRDRLLTMHIATADTSQGGKVAPYTQEPPYDARKALLDEVKDGIYRDFGGIDLRGVSAGQLTATAIKAAYEALNQKADDFEMQVIDCVQGILRLMGIEDTPVFKRSIIANEAEQVQMVMQEAEVLDRETLLTKLPNVTPDEIETILTRKAEEEASGAASRFVRDTGEGAESDAVEVAQDVDQG